MIAHQKNQTLARQPYKLRKPPTSTHQLESDETLDPWNLDRIRTFRLYRNQNIFFSIKICDSVYWFILFDLPYCWLFDENKLYASLPQQSMLLKFFSMLLNFNKKKKPHKTIHNLRFQVNDVLTTTHHDKLNEFAANKENRTHTKRCWTNAAVHVLQIYIYVCCDWIYMVFSNVLVQTADESKKETKYEHTAKEGNPHPNSSI